MTDKEKEILMIGAEESAEVIKEVFKCIRFGLDSVSPNDIIKNRTRLGIEIGDFLCMVDLMVENGIVNSDVIYESSQLKREKLKVWSNIFGETK